MLRICAIRCCDEAYPNMGMGPHLIRFNVSDKLFQALLSLPLVLVRCHSSKVDFKGLDNGQLRDLEKAAMFRVMRKVVEYNPIEKGLHGEA